jgi:gamma-glutamyltranspeptidase
MNCHAQLVSNLLDHGLGAADALAAPRIDASTPELLASARLPEATRRALAALGHRVVARDERLFTGDFASPCAVVPGSRRLPHRRRRPVLLPGERGRGG